MGEQEAISLYQKSKKFPPEVQRLIKKEVCGKWPKVFPFSNWCAYTEVIKQKQASFLENAVDNVIRGNEVINVLYFNLILFYNVQKVIIDKYRGEAFIMEQDTVENCCKE